MRFTILIIFLLGCVGASSQETIKISAGTGITLTGNVFFIAEKMNLVNDGAVLGFDQSSLKFTGNTNNDLSGIGTYSLQTLLINKSSINYLRLKQNIQSLYGTLQFQSGLLDLDNYSIDLGSLGLVSGENESSRAFTIGDGFLRAETDHGKAGQINPGNLGAIISSATAMGVTEVKRGHSISTITGTSNSIRRWYNISTAINNGLNATLNASYFDAELNNLDEQQLSFWKSSNNINWTHEGFSTRNTLVNNVELSGIQSFSRWTMATMPISQPCSVVVSIPDAYSLSQGVPPNTVFLGYPGAGSITFNSNVSGGTTPFNYDWKNQSTGGLVSVISTLTVQPTVNTSYLLTVTDANGCTATATKQVLVIDARCGNKGDKVPVCLNGPKPKTICVSPEAVEALIQNGATLGPCGSNVITKTIEKPGQSNDLPFSAHLTATAMPNPSAHDFNLLISGSSNQSVSIRVFDNTGRLIESRQNIPAIGVIKLGATYQPGSYMVEIIQGSERVTIKLMKGLKSF